MKASFVFSCLIFLSLHPAVSQETITLRYEKKQKTYHRQSNGKVVLVEEQLSTAVLLRKREKILYYEKPESRRQLLELTEEGTALASGSSAPADAWGTLYFRDIDSLFNLVRINRGGSYIVNRFPIWKGDQVWTILPDTRQIGRFFCQRAQLHDHGDLVWEVWFTDEVPLGYNLYNLMELPGMVVEATLFYPYTEFRLTEYAAHVLLRDEDLFPEVLKVKPNLLSRKAYETSMTRLRELRRMYAVRPEQP
ncbi:MAG TPA: hypothetical protein PKE63_05980 [Lacibacter sp.]|nr:hypothetical protein [Lacibacter sp.]HMO90485.1 hypothetical protein [Lacibacter sp.]HMP86807.1 hypothetical protein [Lacibacter sp.]